jgi:hypothetical protein
VRRDAMKILAVIQGNYGQRMVDTWRQHGPQSWDITTLELAGPFPVVIEDPMEFLPSEIPAADLVISLGEQPGLAALLPDIVKAAGARAVIAPVDSRAWLPPGLAKQLKRTFDRMGVNAVFPVPFCSLQASDSDDPLIREFAEHFGMPVVAVEITGEQVHAVDVNQSAPCGSTYFVADGLRTVRIEDAEEQSGLLHHNYPCLATMTVDWEFQDTLMHRAGYFVKRAVHDALKGEGGE